MISYEEKKEHRLAVQSVNGSLRIEGLESPPEENQIYE
jgi:hypothetical protein